MIEKPLHRRSFNDPGHAHELTFTCYRNYHFLASDRTCGWLAEAIEEARIDQDFALWAFVFMPDHVHLIVWPRRLIYSVAGILKATKSPVGRRDRLPESAPDRNGCRGSRAAAAVASSGCSGSRAEVTIATSMSPGP